MMMLVLFNWCFFIVMNHFTAQKRNESCYTLRSFRFNFLQVYIFDPLSLNKYGTYIILHYMNWLQNNI